jgi:putative phosphoesterase
MKIAVISDVHGNIYALSSVLSVAKHEGADKLLVLGDSCGYYYHADKVMKQLNEWDCTMIRGNHEDLLLMLKNGEIDREFLRKKYGSGHNMALAKLTDVEFDKLTLSPEKLSVEYEGIRIMMCHGSPLDANQYLYPDTNIDILEKCDVEGMDLVLVGHSHYPFIFPNKFSTLVNVGSVGQSRTTGGIASWIMINSRNRTFETRATPYNIEPLEKEVTIVDPDVPYLKNILRRQRP